MTFRPSDDVLDEISAGQQNVISGGENTSDTQSESQYVPMDFGNDGNLETADGSMENVDKNQSMVNIGEEIKAPDLSEILKNGVDGDNENSENQFGDEIVNSGIVSEGAAVENPEIFFDHDEKQEDDFGNIVGDNQVQGNVPTQLDDSDLVDTGKLSDKERTQMVSGIEGSINSSLDLLVDTNCMTIIDKYKKVNRLFFRWGTFLFVTVIAIGLGMFLQVKAGNTNNGGVINDSIIENKDRWIESTSDKILSPLSENGIDINVLVPYGSASTGDASFQSRSNLISYKGLILPQLSFIDYNSNNFISLEDFDNHKVSREDIENIVKYLITNNSIYRKTSSLPNVKNSDWVGNSFGGSLIDYFSLGCVAGARVSDFICDRFLETFNKYGKYYDLNKYSSEILKLIKILKKDGRDIEPICNMVNEYVLHSGVISEDLTLMMKNCKTEDVAFYTKMVQFIEVENSLGLPELSDKVFDDPDVNAYKLLSAQQAVYGFLGGVSFNSNYIKSYLNFVQSLINKDKGTNKYIHPFYKDELYVFNSDELSPFLIENSYTDLKLQIEQINKGNSLYGYSSLISQLTTTGLVGSGDNITGVVHHKTIEEIFAPYYDKTDRLKIRKVDFISDELMKIQTEVFTERIFGVTDGETLKVTATMHMEDNTLYVDSIKVANQPKLSEILNIYVSEGEVTFNALLSYIEEQVGMWYEVELANLELQPTFCETINEREDISVYVCDDSSISLYKGDVEYNFVLITGVLDSFTISDKNLENTIKTKLDGVMFMKDSTPSIITSIIDFTIESKDDTLEKKIGIIDQFRIHFRLVPDDIHDVKGKSDVFLVYFTLGEFKLQGYYDVNTQTLTKISYADCGERSLEIKGLSIEVTVNNESELMEILNNPRVYFAKVNPTVYKKYQKVCGG